jgi:hypothetical protein
MAFTAGFDTWCPRCGEDIDEGDPVEHLLGEGIVHKACAHRDDDGDAP